MHAIRPKNKNKTPNKLLANQNKEHKKGNISSDFQNQIKKANFQDHT
jgi:hypothetical protein